jgi:hypothetical protein
MNFVLARSVGGSAVFGNAEPDLPGRIGCRLVDEGKHRATIRGHTGTESGTIRLRRASGGDPILVALARILAMRRVQ